jgi:hypothetical protein
MARFFLPFFQNSRRKKIVWFELLAKSALYTSLVDTALLRNVRRELKEIKAKSENSPDPDAILDLGRSLRHLLIDKGNGLLKKAWDDIKVPLDLPKEPMIRALNLNKIAASHTEDGKGAYTIASNVTMSNGVQPLGIFSVQRALTNDELKKLSFDFDLVDFKISKYRDSTCLVLGPRSVSRENVIKYVANKLGGVHYDKTRDYKEKNRAETEAFLLLDASFDFYSDDPQPSNLAVSFGANGNALHAAILGMCRDLLNSPDVQKLEATIDANVKPQPYLGFK